MALANAKSGITASQTQPIPRQNIDSIPTINGHQNNTVANPFENYSLSQVSNKSKGSAFSKNVVNKENIQKKTIAQKDRI